MPCLALPSRALLQTMRDLLTHGAAAFGLSGFVVVDCRYEYEHKGGHLPGAQRRSMSLAMWPRTATCLLACTSLSHQHRAPADLPSFMLLLRCTGALHLTTPDELLQFLASRPEEHWQVGS